MIGCLGTYAFLHCGSLQEDPEHLPVLRNCQTFESVVVLSSGVRVLWIRKRPFAIIDIMGRTSSRKGLGAIAEGDNRVRRTDSSHHFAAVVKEIWHLCEQTLPVRNTGLQGRSNTHRRKGHTHQRSRMTRLHSPPAPHSLLESSGPLGPHHQSHRQCTWRLAGRGSQGRPSAPSYQHPSRCMASRQDLKI